MNVDWQVTGDADAIQFFAIGVDHNHSQLFHPIPEEASCSLGVVSQRRR